MGPCQKKRENQEAGGRREESKNISKSRISRGTHTHKLTHTQAHTATHTHIRVTDTHSHTHTHGHHDTTSHCNHDPDFHSMFHFTALLVRTLVSEDPVFIS